MAEVKQDLLINIKINNAEFVKGSKEVEKSFDGIEKAIEETETASVNLKTELRNVKKQLLEVDPNSAKFKELRDRAGELTDQISETNNSVKLLATDGIERKLGASIGAVETVAGAFGAVQSSLALFGIESEVVNTSLQKLAATTTLLNSLNAIKNATNKDSALALFLENKGITANTIAKKGAAIAQRLWTLAVGQTTGAMKLLRVALISTGIGALVVGVGLLIANFKEVTGFVDKLRGRLRDFLENLTGSAEAAKWLGYYIELLISPITLLVHGVQELSKYLGLVDAKKITTDLEALNKSLERSEAIFERTNRSLSDNIALLKAKGATDKEISEKEIELLQRRADQWQGYSNIVQENVKKITDSGRRLTEDEQKALDDFNKKVQDAQLALAVKEAEVRKKRADEYKKFMQDITNLERDLQAEINQLIIQGIKDEGLRNKEELIEQNRIANIKLDEQEKQLKKEGKLTEDIQSLIAERRFLIQRKFNNDLAHLEEDEAKKRQAKQKELDAEAQKRYEESLEGRIAAIQDAARMEEMALQEGFINTGRNQKERIEQEKQHQLEILQIKRKALQDQLAITIQEGLELSKIFGQIPAEQQKLIDQLKASLVAMNAELEALSKNTSIVSEEFASKFEEIKNTIMSVAGEFANVINQAFQNQLANIDKVGEAQKQAIEDSTLTEKQKQRQIEKIEKETAQKRYKIELEQFNFNKGVQIVQAIANTASAVVAALANPVPFVGGVLAAIAAATGAAQIAVISAQQPPSPPSFEIGGYTGNGNIREESTALGRKDYIYHKGEYVVPNKILRTSQGSRLVSALEGMRLGTRSSLGLSGFADGGFTASQISERVNGQLQAEQISSIVTSAISNVQIVTKVTDINRVNNNLAQARIKSTIR